MAGWFKWESDVSPTHIVPNSRAGYPKGRPKKPPKIQKQMVFTKVPFGLRLWWNGWFDLTGYSDTEYLNMIDRLREDNIKCVVLMSDGKVAFFHKCYRKIWKHILQKPSANWSCHVKIYFGQEEDAVLFRLKMDS